MTLLDDAIARALMQVPFGPQVPPLPPTQVVPDPRTLVLPSQPLQRFGRFAPFANPYVNDWLNALNRNPATAVAPLPNRIAPPGRWVVPIPPPQPVDPGMIQRNFFPPAALRSS